jgi:hypothetical protein
MKLQYLDIYQKMLNLWANICKTVLFVRSRKRRGALDQTYTRRSAQNTTPNQFQTNHPITATTSRCPHKPQKNNFNKPSKPYDIHPFKSTAISNQNGPSTQTRKSRQVSDLSIKPAFFGRDRVLAASYIFRALDKNKCSNDYYTHTHRRRAAK